MRLSCREDEIKDGNFSISCSYGSNINLSQNLFYAIVLILCDETFQDSLENRGHSKVKAKDQDHLKIAMNDCAPRSKFKVVGRMDRHVEYVKVKSDFFLYFSRGVTFTIFEMFSGEISNITV